jgi:hypothetical protein
MILFGREIDGNANGPEAERSAWGRMFADAGQFSPFSAFWDFGPAQKRESPDHLPKKLTWAWFNGTNSIVALPEPSPEPRARSA